jgi:RimJ/RimL family protein N-acetyltransferase
MCADELNLHRIHVTVSARNVRAIKWIERIYFKREGVLKKYTFDKNDMIMYSRIFER